MTFVTRTVKIDSPVAVVWKILAALDTYHHWESGYVSSEYTSEQRSGAGATRRVELKSPMGVRWAIHRVTRWEEPTVIAWRAESSNFPLLDQAEQTVNLTAMGNSTHVENTVAYNLKYGRLGRLIDPVIFRPIVTGAAQGFVDSLAMAASPHQSPGRDTGR